MGGLRSSSPRRVRPELADKVRFAAPPRDPRRDRRASCRSTPASKSCGGRRPVPVRRPASVRRLGRSRPPTARPTSRSCRAGPSNAPDGSFLSRRGAASSSTAWSTSSRDAFNGADPRGRADVRPTPTGSDLPTAQGDPAQRRRHLPARVLRAPVAPGNLQVHWPEGEVLLDRRRRSPEAASPTTTPWYVVPPLTTPFIRRQCSATWPSCGSPRSRPFADQVVAQARSTTSVSSRSDAPCPGSSSTGSVCRPPRSGAAESRAHRSPVVHPRGPSGP